MAWFFGKAEPANRLGSQKRKLRERLATAGLLRKRIHVLTSTEILGADKSPATRLGELLGDLGPLYAAFREYLALRADLLPLADCFDLAQSPPEELASLPRERVLAILRRELGKPADELLLTLSEPLRGNALFQWHRAELANGTLVSIKLLRPELEAQLQSDNHLIAMLDQVRLLTQDGSMADMAAALPQFRDYLTRRMDLAAEKEALGQMAAASQYFDTFSVPLVYPQLCSSRVITTESLVDAQPLNDVTQEHHNQDLGRRLALLWLQQALLGGLYPEGPLVDEIVLMDNGHLGITGGLFGRLDSRVQADLLRYLTASARDEMDRACDLLLGQCESGTSATSQTRMQHLFRQSEPFRSGGWSHHYAGQRLSDTLFVQWRLAHKHHYRFKPVVEAFARSLYDVEFQCRRLAPERDGLRQGLNDVRVISAAVRMREYLGPGNFQENMHQLVATSSLILRRTADISSEQERNANSKRKVAKKSHRGFSIKVLGLLLVLVCLALVMQRLFPEMTTAELAEPGAALLYGLTALVFFWHIGSNDAG
jgi:predicted unusual protein kinase regulating ubiquinone biosynthesis (AarF/ABC1/UbiB family)